MVPLPLSLKGFFCFFFYCQSNNLSAFKFLYIHLISSSNYRCQHCLKRFSIFLEELCLHILFYQEYFSLHAVLSSLVGKKNPPNVGSRNTVMEKFGFNMTNLQMSTCMSTFISYTPISSCSVKQNIGRLLRAGTM